MVSTEKDAFGEADEIGNLGAVALILVLANLFHLVEFARQTSLWAEHS